jgi:hypothetical protein
MKAHKLPPTQFKLVSQQEGDVFENRFEWEAYLSRIGITTERHVRIVTEGALLGSALTHGLHPETVILSDDAGQFDVLRHALCWLHGERGISKLVGFNKAQRSALEDIRTQIWELYNDLKKYRAKPTQRAKKALESRFEQIFTSKTCFASLNQALKRLYTKKAELLLVLERPEIPLHNNTSERDIREYVKKRKISGSTRHEEGRRCRDTFASVKKTCRKLGVSFWDYLQSRLLLNSELPTLGEMIQQRSQAPPVPVF